MATAMSDDKPAAGSDFLFDFPTTATTTAVTPPPAETSTTPTHADKKMSTDGGGRSSCPSVPADEIPSGVIDLIGPKMAQDMPCILRNGTDLVAYESTLVGDWNRVDGNYLVVYGDRHLVRGNNNTVYGNFNCVIGDKIAISGTYNCYYGKLNAALGFSNRAMSLTDAIAVVSGSREKQAQRVSKRQIFHAQRSTTTSAAVARPWVSTAMKMAASVSEDDTEKIKRAISLSSASAMGCSSSVSSRGKEQELIRQQLTDMTAINPLTVALEPRVADPSQITGEMVVEQVRRSRQDQAVILDFLGRLELSARNCMPGTLSVVAVKQILSELSPIKTNRIYALERLCARFAPKAPLRDVPIGRAGNYVAAWALGDVRTVLRSFLTQPEHLVTALKAMRPYWSIEAHLCDRTANRFAILDAFMSRSTVPAGVIAELLQWGPLKTNEQPQVDLKTLAMSSAAVATTTTMASSSSSSSASSSSASGSSSSSGAVLAATTTTTTASAETLRTTITLPIAVGGCMPSRSELEIMNKPGFPFMFNGRQ